MSENDTDKSNTKVRLQEEDFLNGCCNLLAYELSGYVDCVIHAYTMEGFPLDGLIHCYIEHQGNYYDAKGNRGPNLDWLHYEFDAGFSHYTLTRDELLNFNNEWIEDEEIHKQRLKYTKIYIKAHDELHKLIPNFIGSALFKLL